MLFGVGTIVPSVSRISNGKPVAVHNFKGLVLAFGKGLRTILFKAPKKHFDFLLCCVALRCVVVVVLWLCCEQEEGGW